MSASLARRIRRIGVLKAEVTVTNEQVLLKDEQGQDIVVTKPVTHRKKRRAHLSLEELSLERQRIIEAWREARRQRKERERLARAQSRKAQNRSK